MAGAQRYVARRTATVEAMRWTGDNTEDIAAFMGRAFFTQPQVIRHGDYVIRTAYGHFFVLPDSIFEQRYQLAEADEQRWTEAR